MTLDLWIGSTSGDKRNCLYPKKVEISTPEDMAKALKFDHVCAEYEKNYRSAGNFLHSNVVVMDCDNDHSDDPEDWITPEKLDELMPDIAYVIAPSRHNLLPKDGKSPRPRFHVYFLIPEITDAAYYAGMKRAIHSVFPFFDGNALDAARFIFGADVDTDDVVWHDGWILISDEIAITDDEQEFPISGGAIPEGNRNNTLSLFAAKVLKRYGESEKAKNCLWKKRTSVTHHFLIVNCRQFGFLHLNSSGQK